MNCVFEYCPPSRYIRRIKFINILQLLFLSNWPFCSISNIFVSILQIMHLTIEYNLRFLNFLLIRLHNHLIRCILLRIITTRVKLRLLSHLLNSFLYVLHRLLLHFHCLEKSLHSIFHYNEFVGHFYDFLFNQPLIIFEFFFADLS